jgi:hypothetical protein
MLTKPIRYFAHPFAAAAHLFTGLSKGESKLATVSEKAH